MSQATQRDKMVRRVIVLEGSANAIVLIAKTIVGFSTGSLAVLADAIHSLTDVANNFVAWLVIRIAAMPADREHPYGHKKFETLAVFVLASLLVVLAFELTVSAIKREPTVVASSQLELITMIVVLLINIGLATWERVWARKLKSDILLADASHTFADVMITATVIIGWQLSAMGYVWIDRLCAIGVSLLVLYLAFSLFKRAIPTLVDEFAVDPEALSTTALTVPGVQRVQRVRSRWIGSAKAVDIIIAVDAQLSTEESHAIADQVETKIEERFGIKDIAIHIEPLRA